MKLALIFLSVFTTLSLSLVPQVTPPAVCRGKALQITMMPGPKMTGPAMPLRFGGTRMIPTFGIFSQDALRRVIRTRDEFSEVWKRFTDRMSPGNSAPAPLPEIDFSKEMVVFVAMGQRGSSGYQIFIDGACELNNKVEVYVNNVENDNCSAA